MKKLLLIGCLLLTTEFTLAQNVVINELMSSNTSTVADEDGDFPDWIELYNPGSTAVSLQGYGLSDDPSVPFKWTFPDVTLASGKFLLVFASGKNRLSGPYLHTNFKISAAGEPLQLVSANGITVDAVPAIALAQDASYGRQPDGSGNWVVFATNPTPGKPNASAGSALLPAPVFSQNAGFYTNAFSLTLSSDPGAQIRYTLDGSEPNESSPLYTAPLLIKSRAGDPNVLSIIPTNEVKQGVSTYYPPQGEVFKATVVRARTFRNGAIPSDAVTRTYFVDPQIGQRYPLPVISIVTDEDGFFGGKEGIYVPGDDFNGDNDRSGHYFQRGEAWERPAHLEFFDTDRTQGFAQQVGIRIHGSASRVDPEKSLRIYADKKYGKASIQYPLFPDKPITEYRRFLLRNAGNDRSFTMLRDVFTQGLVKDLDLDVQANRPAIVFINGEYWGIHHLQERLDKHYLAANHGVDADNLDFLEMDQAVVEGDATHYQAMLDFISSHDIRERAHFDTLARMMDMDEFITYQAAELYAANVDWPGNNLDYWRPRTANGKWRWIFYDLDYGFGLAANSNFDRDMLSYATDPNGPLFGTPAASNVPSGTLLLRTLLTNEYFRNRFINRFADLLNTSFQPARVLQRLEALKTTLNPVFPEHIARWNVPSSMNQWNSNLDVLRTFATYRPPYQRQHLLRFFNLPDTAVVTLNVSDPARGMVQINTLTISAQTPGAGTTPYPWQGVYMQGVPVRITALPKPGYRFSGWSDASLPQQASIEVTLTGDFSVTALFDVQNGSPFTLPAPFALAQGTYSFSRWSPAQAATTYPAHMAFFRTTTVHPDLADAFTANYLDSYQLPSGTRVDGLDTDGFAFVNADPDGNVGGAVLALNTSGRTNISLQWTAGTVAPNARRYALRLQYQIGSNGWMNVLNNGSAVEYVGQPMAGTAQSFLTNLSQATGNAIDNQPLVYLRWKYYLVSGNAGTGTEIRLSDVAVSSRAYAALPVQLVISRINNSNPPSRNQPFSVTVHAQDNAGNPQTVLSDTQVRLSLQTGNGTLTGNLTGTIRTGQSSGVITGMLYNLAESGVRLNATVTAGDALQTGNSQPFNVLDAANQLVFVNNYPYGAAGTTYRPFVIAARRADNSLDINFNGTVTVALASGKGTLSGSLTQPFRNGLAQFSNLVFSEGDFYTLSASSNGLPTVVTSPIKISGMTEVILPQYVQGRRDSNDHRVPYVFRATLHHLNANAIYRYFTQVVYPNDTITVNGSGNAIFTCQDGGFTRTSGVSVDKSGEYGEFTTDSSGSYTGWFILEPTGGKRFTPGNLLKLRFILNDGGGGDSPFFRFTSNSTLQVVDFGNTPTAGSAIVGTACAAGGNVALLYDNAEGSGRPLAATLIENDGIDNTARYGYAPFYASQVNGQAGAWGTIVPNRLPNGIRRIEQRQLTDGALAGASTSANGVWGTLSTVNPTGGLNPMVLPAGTAPLVNPPVITQDGADLVASASLSYQWYRNDTLIAGATGQRYTPGSTGAYKVLSNAGICSNNFSQPFSFVLTDVPAPPAASRIQVYPNPTTGQVRIAFSSLPPQTIEVRLYDLMGRELHRQQLSNTGDHDEFSLDLSQVPDGLYLLHIRTEQTRDTQKLILQR